MREQGRVFGNNLKFLLHQREISEADFAEKLGYTSYQLQEIMDARMILNRQAKEKIADQLGVREEDLYAQRPDPLYQEAGCMECRGSFEHVENKKLILDLFDMYCDMQEVLAMED